MPAVLRSVNKRQTGANADRANTTEMWDVLYDIPDVTAVTARSASGLPAYNAAHPDDSALTVADRRARRVGKSGLFEVEVTYKVNTTALGGDRAISPLSRPTRSRLFPIVSQIEVDTDASAAFIRNSAGQPQKSSIQWADLGLSYTRNEATFAPAYSAYFFKTNTATFNGFAIGQVLCTGITQEYAEEVYRGAQVVYYVTTFNFAVAFERFTAAPGPVYWKSRLLDAGTMQKVGGDLIPIVDGKTGSYVTSPVPLDGAGLKLSATGVPTFVNWTVYGTANFATLGL